MHDSRPIRAARYSAPSHQALSAMGVPYRRQSRTVRWVMLARDRLGGLAEEDACGVLVHSRRGVDRLAFRIGANRRGALADVLLPAAQIGEVVDILLLPLGKDPWPARHVGDGIEIARDKAPVGKLAVERAI